MLAAHAHEQGVVLGEGALGLEGSDDGGVEQFGKGGQLGGGAGVDDALAGVDEGMACAQQQVGGGVHIGGVGGGFVAPRWDIGVGSFVISGGGVGDGQDNGAGASAAEHRKGAAQELGGALRAVNVAEPLGDGFEAGGDIKLGVFGAAGGDAVGDAEHRGVVLKSLGQSGVGVLEAGAVDAALYGADADALAGGDAGVGVGQGDGVAVVAHHNHGHAGGAEGVVDAADGEGGDPGDVLLLEDAGDGGGDGGGHKGVYLVVGDGDGGWRIWIDGWDCTTSQTALRLPTFR